MRLSKSNYNRLNQAATHLCDVILDVIGDEGRQENTITLSALDILALKQIRNILDNFIALSKAN